MCPGLSGECGNVCGEVDGHPWGVQDPYEGTNPTDVPRSDGFARGIQRYGF